MVFLGSCGWPAPTRDQVGSDVRVCVRLSVYVCKSVCAGKVHPLGAFSV